MNLQSASNDVLKIIFNFLKIKDLVSLCFVCKKFDATLARIILQKVKNSVDKYFTSYEQQTYLLNFNPLSGEILDPYKLYYFKRKIKRNAKIIFEKSFIKELNINDVEAIIKNYIDDKDFYTLLKNIENSYKKDYIFSNAIVENVCDADGALDYELNGYEH